MPADVGRSAPPPDSTIPPATSGATDTGLICLLILARFYDLPADGAQIRHQFGQGGQPLTDRDLVRAAKHLGLKAGLRQIRRSELAATPLPAIAKGTDGHYVVLAKIEGEKILIQDPLQDGPRVLTVSAFEAVWTGHVLLCTRRAHLRPQDLTFDFTWFIPAVVKYRRLLGEVLLASFFLQLFALITPLFIQVVIDKVLVHKGFITLHVLAIGMIALAFFDAVLGGLRTYLFAHTTNRIDVSFGGPTEPFLVVC